MTVGHEPVATKAPFLAVVAALSLVVAFGCEDEPSYGAEQVTRLPPPGRDGVTDPVERAANESTLPVRTRTVPSPHASVGPYAGASAGGGGGGTGRAPFEPIHGRRMDEDEAHAAASAAARTEGRGDHCQQAWESHRTFNQQFHEKTPNAPRGRFSRDRFMEVCEAMPPARQRCMVPSYVLSHEEECNRALGRRWNRFFEDGEGLDAFEEEVVPESEETAGEAEEEAPEPTAGPRRIE